MTPCFDARQHQRFIRKAVRSSQADTSALLHPAASRMVADESAQSVVQSRRRLATNKRQAFLQTLFGGGITPPIFLNDLRTRGREGVYDGVNRLATIMGSWTGNPTSPTRKGARLYRPPLGCCKANHGCLKRCVAFDPSIGACSRHHDRPFLWDNLSTAEACGVAQHLSEGTAMTMGEKLRLLCGLGTPSSLAQVPLRNGRVPGPRHAGSRAGAEDACSLPSPPLLARQRVLLLSLLQLRTARELLPRHGAL